MATFPQKTLRIIDANLDRATEGLRVLEDIARFALDSEPISQEMKALRHSLHQAFDEVKFELISSRDSPGDVGQGSAYPKEAADSLVDTVIANSRRVAQSLRTIEEILRSTDKKICALDVEGARFRVYALEKELVSELCRKTNRALVGRLYASADSRETVYKAVEMEPSAIQLNPSGQSRRDFWELAAGCRDICAEKKILFLIGERIDVAAAVKADGVVIGRDSLPVKVIRELLGIKSLIGFIAHDAGEALTARDAGVDFLIDTGGGGISELETPDLPVIKAC
ncbi:thiamine phosphate synthase [Dehalogenimonas alkenigignens]|uniref:Thiamine monophosphate synthase/TENI n=1 Tax=Dehalogenimonas alkenigignens TaxID=1217799 RepID=A0A0W0GJH5_9CHLR|nr:thiamine phosphate synthase [Dehalogenimonas alkenigignens]KTB48708.1 Thiamine monophosphate synthase/TENI [Dehalogenimonas alkenigignens]PVV84874.1 thiamine phosphate synthase [Dehalogenimonas alkenigignens]